MREFASQILFEFKLTVGIRTIYGICFLVALLVAVGESSNVEMRRHSKTSNLHVPFVCGEYRLFQLAVAAGRKGWNPLSKPTYKSVAAEKFLQRKIE